MSVATATTPSTTRRAGRTLSVVYTATIVNLGGAQLFTLLLFGLLPATQIGLVNWATAAAGIAFYVGDIGIETSVVVIAKSHAVRLRTMAAVVGVIRFLTGLLAIALWALAAATRWLPPTEAMVLGLVGLGFIARSVQTPFMAHLQVGDRQATAALVQVLPVAVRLAGTAALVLAHRFALVPVLLVMLAGDVTGVVVMALAAGRLPSPPAVLDARRLLSELARSAPLVAVSQTILVGQNRVDWLLVAALASYTALANYSLANKALELLVLSGSVFGRTALPWLVEGWDARGLPRTVRLLTAAVVGAGGLFAAFGAPILHLLFGSKYDGAAPVIPMLAALAPSLALYQVAQFLAFAHRRTVDAIVSGGLGLVAQVAVDLAFIPGHGITGAAYGMFAFAAVAFPAQLLLGWRARILPGAAAVELAAGGAILPAILLVIAQLGVRA